MKINCPNCSANMVFSPHEGKCFCEHCFKYIEIKDITYNASNVYYEEMKCRGCGASIIIDETNIVIDCIYCGSHQILTRKLEKNFKPNSLLPFKSDKEDVKKYYQKFIKEYKKYFSKSIKTEISDDEITGIYVPFFVYTWDMKLYADTTRTVCVYSDRKVVKKDGGRKFNDDLMELLQAFDFENEEPFNPAYLLGFYAEIPDNDEVANFDLKREMKEISKRVYNEPLYQKSLERIEKNLSNNERPRYNLEFKELKYMLLPVWFINIDEKYNFVINGRTGTRACLINNVDNSKLIFDKTSDKIIRRRKIKLKKTIASKVVSSIRNIFIVFVLALILLLMGYYAHIGATEGAPIIVGILIIVMFVLIVFGKK